MLVVSIHMYISLGGGVDDSIAAWGYLLKISGKSAHTTCQHRTGVYWVAIENCRSVMLNLGKCFVIMTIYIYINIFYSFPCFADNNLDYPPFG